MLKGARNMRLNIIGNGFDLYHGLPSSYYYFGCFLLEYNQDFYEEMADMFGFRKGTYSGYPFEEITYGVEDIFWRDFEANLGKISSFWVQEKLQDDLGLENDDPIEIEMYQYENAGLIKSMLTRWIKEVVDKPENYRILGRKLNEYNKMLKLKKKDYFVTFNYTHILEDVYMIPNKNILHIHGENTGSDYDELIIGHGNDEYIEELYEVIERYERRGREQASVNRMSEYKCELYTLQELRKDVKRCLSRCENFFRNFEEEPTEICIYGLSLGDVDIPYLIYIREHWPNAKWKFSFYSEKDKENIKNVAEEILKLSAIQCKTFELKNEMDDYIRDCVINEQRIVEYDKI